ncbi:MAG TPA: DUF2142 domain-containing protein [Candidatus Saccharimonadales bacterium]|nr:DUF2142 domain-containing protein [Candidatus Saccharimonadales bacterium]
MLRKLYEFVASRRFFYVIVVIFALQAAWIALTSRYPMAFDENFHFGLIRIYSHHWLPFLDSQPPDAAVYGAVARDPSYLYHYVMSFPYRLVAAITASVAVQIITLRFINVAIVVAALFVYEKVLRFTPLTGAYRNAVLLFFTLLPIMPVLTGQVNYDGLFIFGVGLSVLLALQFLERLRGGVFDGWLLIRLAVVCLLSSLVKYAFLPVFAAIGVYLLVVIALYIRRTGWHKFRHVFVRGIRHASYLKLVAYICVSLVAGGLFFQRYGINVVRYHTPLPDCAQVITVQECKQYAPWGRNYAWAADNIGRPRRDPATYAWGWIKNMMRETFFAVYAAFIGKTHIVGYWGELPIPVLLHTAWTVLTVGFLLSVVYARRIFRSPAMRFLAVVTLVYVLALFYQNYQTYREVDVAVSIHGRYLFGIVPFMLAWFAWAAREGFTDVVSRFTLLRRNGQTLKLATLAVLLLLALQGGGFTTHIVRGADKWYWQQSQPAMQANRTMQRALRTVIFE